MTLHWWMHWFWITCLTITAVLCASTAPNTDATDEPPHYAITTPEPVPGFRYITRTGKAIGFTPKVSLSVVLTTPAPTSYQKVSIVYPVPPGDDVDLVPPTPPSTSSSSTVTPATTSTSTTTTVAPKITKMPLKYVNITRTTTTSTTSTTTTTTLPPPQTNSSKIEQSEEDVTETIHPTESDMVIVTEIPKNDTVNIVNEVEEPGVSTVRALSLETAVGRRAAADVPNNSVLTPSDRRDDKGLDAGAVAGICFGTLVLLALAGAVSFVLYRRRYLNKPQTLNDKCSNPDSSGYIDDSTIRENSEEMYSLDNDSFLNSLEAMTIQNYWTDSVKHTKL